MKRNYKSTYHSFSRIGRLFRPEKLQEQLKLQKFKFFSAIINALSIFILLVLGNTASAQSALSFGSNNTNTYVTFGNKPALGLSQFTIECWFKRTGTGVSISTGTGGITCIPLLAKGTSESDGGTMDCNYFMGINTSGNKLAADFEEGSGGTTPGLNHPITGTTTIVNDVWHHAAATYDGATWNLYLNGNLEATLTVNQPCQNQSVQHSSLASSLRTTGVAQGFFAGTIDEARVWNSARTLTQIRSAINSQITSPQTGLVAGWGLNESTGTSVGDISGNVLTGTITGTNYTHTASGAPFNFVFSNNVAPTITLNAPTENAQCVGTNANLSVSVADANTTDLLTVKFYGRKKVQAPGDFTIIGLPDTQFYTEQTNGGSNATFKAQTSWIVANKTALNIKHVSQLGDCVQNGDNGGNDIEWKRADTSMKIIEDPITTSLTDGIPYTMNVGNHDQTPGGSASGTTTFFNQYFGTSRFASRAYWGGNYGSNADNSYQLFSANGMDFIVVSLEYDPTANASVITWANNLLQTYSSRKAIIVSHWIINANGTFGAQGQAVYNGLKANPNLMLMLCGHINPNGEARRSDVFNGKTVHTLLSDYQDINGGNGWLRIMAFSPATNTISVKTYSPTLNQYQTDDNSQFTISNVNLFDNPIPYQLLSTQTTIGSGTLTYNWTGLQADSTYEWYATVQDTTLLTTSSVLKFNAGAGPVVKLGNDTTIMCGQTLTLDAKNPGFNYLWSTGATTKTINVTAAGDYSVNVTNPVSGCFTSDTIHINVSTSLSAALTVTNVNCNGGNTGAIALTPSGGSGTYTYLWSNAATTQNISNLIANTYSVTITDGLGCSYTTSGMVTQPTALTLSAPTITPTNGGYNGTIKVNPTGGTSPYTYSWKYNNGSSNITTQTLSTTHVGGSYFVTVKDNKNCTVTATYSHAIPVVAGSTVLLPWNSSWKYKDDGSNQGTGWRASGFDDSSWPSAAAEFGYGDGDETTLLNACGTVAQTPTCTNKYITTYLRKKINIPSLSGFQNIKFNTFRDDGIVVYVNNIEVYRSNMPTSTITYTTGASTAVSDDGETLQTQTVTLAASSFIVGDNTIAVELHQQNGSSSDVTFNMEILGVPPVPEVLTRGPYFLRATQSSMEVKWLTDLAATSKVRYGLTNGVYTDSVTDAASSTSHVINLTNLQPNTKYFYTIGSTSRQLQGDANNFFVTPPVPGSTGKYNFWLVGDCGNNSTNQKNVRDAYINYMGSNVTNGWLLLGDNAYSSGTESEYQAEFFDVYHGTVSKNMPLYPSPGNHDYSNGTKSDHSVPYYSIFDMPANGEAGGIASNTEAYYSYDYGNIHFLSLDSYGKEDGTNRLYDTLGPQVTWIKQDLAANSKKWIVAYWHHPPYTMGSHNSDTEAELTKMHTNLIKILERYKVDLIVCGHSHEYERSKLIQGHYGSETTFNPAVHNLSQSNGRYDGTTNSCTYVKDSTHTFNGTVYVVSGSAGQLDASVQAAWPHNAMSAYNNSTNGGSMLLTVEGNRLDAKWVCADGVVRDQFTMIKDANKVRNYTINSGQSLTLTASWKGQYVWNHSSETTASVNVSPTTNTTYVVTDQYQCVADTFKVTVIQPTIITVVNNSTACAGAAMNVEASSTGIFNTGNIFTAELSDANGSFSAATAIGTLSSTTPGTINSIIPAITPSGVGYRIRVRSSNPFIIGSDNGNNITINAIPSQPAAFTTSSTNVNCGQNAVVYTVPNDPSVTTYTWTYSGAGATINGAGNSVTVDFSLSATGGTLSVTPSTNGCNGIARTISVSIGAMSASSSQSPYLLNVTPGAQYTAMLTTGDTVGGYKMCGTPDGMGAFDNGNGTFTILMNHEFGNTAGIARAHGSKGSFVSKWIVNKSNLNVVSGSDLIQTVKLWNGSGYTTYNAATPSALTAFNRFCSADLAPVTAFYNSATGLGTQNRIFMNGEESGNEGRAFGHIVTGSEAGTTYELPYLGKFSWENSVACPFTGNKTVVAGMDDSTPGQVYFYIGTKTNTGTDIDKAGLNNGKLFGIAVTGYATETNANLPAANAAFTLADLGQVQNLTGATINTNSNNAGITTFLRPEDGAWDPAHPGDFYFNTTNAFNSPSRLWKVHFTNIANPELGGTITAVLDGTEGQQMLDNLTIDNSGHILLVEDVGNNAHLGKTWQYTIATDELKQVGTHDPSRFLSGAPNFLTQDEEASGILDVQSILGPGMFIVDDQAHYSQAGELVEGGQLLAFYNPDSYNPTPLVFDVSGGGSHCAGDTTGLAINLSNSQTGVKYSLIRNDSIVVDSLDGTGSILTFAHVISAGTYKVVAKNIANGISVTMNGTTVIHVNSLPEDIDKNGTVDVADLGILLLNFGTNCTCPADINKDGRVNVSDLSLLLLKFGKTCSGATP